MAEITLPYPISANRYWRHFRGRTIKSAAARDYQATAKLIAAQEGVSQPLHGPIMLVMEYHPKRPKKYTGGPVRCLDVSNVVKVAEDALNGIAWIDDSQIEYLCIRKKEPVPDGALVVRWEPA